MGSTRLPGKVLMDLAGDTMLARVICRTRSAETINEVVIATTDKAVDDAIVGLCTERGWRCFRGSESDVLDRYYHAAREHKGDVIVRITSDCPLIEPEIVDRVVTAFMECQPSIDYACNIFPHRSYPRGLDVEVMGLDVLERVWRVDLNPTWREHVTTYIQRNPEIFQIYGMVNKVDYSHMRWTVDTPEDLALVRRIYEHFNHDHFSWRDVLSLLEKRSYWLEINQRVVQKTVL
jgi:spore coat polysaccharide biosynthesis protein SpsF